MAGTNRYTLASEALKEYDGRYLTIGMLRSLIMQKLGSDERTIVGYLTMMRETGLIKETIRGWEIKITSKEEIKSTE